jgi:hypothetical protein
MDDFPIPPNGLAQNNRPGRRSIDVKIAGSNTSLPDGLLTIVEAFEAACQAETVPLTMAKASSSEWKRITPSTGPKSSVSCVKLPG